jgi:hypothetical protein
MPELKRVLDTLPGIEYDLTRLDQESLELLFAEFDGDLEKSIRDEFEADPYYLSDLGIPDGECPLCGHQGCRFIFRLVNTKGGEDIKCGSECIITYGISVKGAETAEAARKLLEKAIREAIKKVKIETWHKEYEFERDHFTIVDSALGRISSWRPGTEYKIWNKARELRKNELVKVIDFYDKHGWLNTERRWESWRKIVAFAVAGDEDAARLLPTYKSWTPPVKKEQAVIKATEQLTLLGA